MFPDGGPDQGHDAEEDERSKENVEREEIGARVERFIRQRGLLIRHDVTRLRRLLDACLLERRHGGDQLLLRELGFDGKLLIFRDDSIQIALRGLLTGYTGILFDELFFNGSKTLIQ